MIEVIAPHLGHGEAVPLLNWSTFPCVVGPNIHAERAVEFMNAVTQLNDHADFTINAFSHLWTNQGLRLRGFRAWCPDCYLDDLRSDQPAYDRLLWAINAVDVCPIHLKRLHSKCLKCGALNERFHNVGYQPGICGYCGLWLEPSVSKRLHELEIGSYAAWKSHAFWEILSCRSEIASCDLSNVREGIVLVLEHLFDGKQSELAKYLRLSKGHVSMCVSGRAVPAPDLLLLISYISQVPLIDFYRGTISRDGFFRLMPLPSDSLHRASTRVRLTEDVRRRVDHVLKGILIGRHPGVSSWTGAAGIAKVNTDTVRSVAGERRQDLSALFLQRRNEQTAWKKAKEIKVVYDAIRQGMAHFERKWSSLCSSPAISLPSSSRRATQS